MTEEEVDYETKVINKIKVFYDFHKTLSKDSFDTFLNEVGLLDIWNTEDEKNYIYDPTNIIFYIFNHISSTHLRKRKKTEVTKIDLKTLYSVILCMIY